MFHASYNDSKQKLTRVRLEFMTHVLHMVIRLLQLGIPGIPDLKHPNLMILNTDLYIEDIIFFYPFMTVKRPVLIGTGKAACSNGRLIYVYRFRCQKIKKLLYS